MYIFRAALKILSCSNEMPGGQYTNLREQARSLGLEHRWPEISRSA